MELLSVVIITYNEENNIGRCVESVKGVADEIVVLDSFSTDKTVQIAKAMGAKVYQQKFAGYIAQKNKALQFADNNYVLSLDADEALDDKLIQAVLAAKNGFVYQAYNMNRCTNCCGKFIRHGSWYPGKKIRLFDKRIARWGGIDPHDKIILKKQMAVKQLPGEILHFSFPTLNDLISQQTRFSAISALSLFKAGKKTNRLKIIMNPVWAFVKDYFFRAGFLNGKLAFIIAKNQARYTFLKHRDLFRLHSGIVKQLQNNFDSNVQPPANTDRLSRDVRAHV